MAEGIKGRRGGAQPGAGRPKGSTNKPKILEHLTPLQIKELVEATYQKAIDGDTQIQIFLMEQLLGKARQNVGIDGGAEGKPLGVVFLPLKDDGIIDNDDERVETTTKAIGSPPEIRG